MKNLGLVEELRAFTDYVLGDMNFMPWIEYREDGDWTQFLPKYEAQARNFETFGCTVWGTQNQIETFEKAIFGTEPNYSENFTYLLTPVNIGYGADPQRVYDCIRHDGLIPNEDLETPDTPDAFTDISRITSSLLAKGQNWLTKYEIKHEWLWGVRPDNALELMKKALKTSPLGISVTAWHQNGEGKYIDNGMPNCHWCICYKIDDTGIYAFDSYDNSHKLLTLDHKIQRAKRIWMNKKTYKASQFHVRILKKILSLLMMQQKTLLQLCEENIGKDVTPDDLVPDTVACAITASTLLNMRDASFPKVAGTWTLWDILEHHKDYERVTVPSAETIVISPTGTGNGSMPGHVGIMLDNNVIASNDSATGKFLKNYTLDTWRDRYVTKGGFKIYMYKKRV